MNSNPTDFVKVEKDSDTTLIVRPSIRWTNLLRTWLKRGLFSILGFLAVYFSIILIGLVPTNIDFKESPVGIEIFITSTPIHADVILPIKNEYVDWQETFPQAHFKGDISAASHVMIGWGNKGFYLETPTWAELKLSTALRALFTFSPCCLHVIMSGQPEENTITRKIKISPQQYQQMVRIVKAQFQEDSAHRLMQIPGKNFHDYDSFYEAHGAYHCLNTCNSWVGYVMRQSGIKTPLITPLPKTVFLYLDQPAP